MRVSVHAPDAPATLIRTAADRFQAGLKRYGSIVRDVKVRLRDENGPRGGEDQSCLVQVDLKGGQQITISETRDTPLQAIGHALKRARRVVSERINKRPRAGRRATRRLRSEED